MNKYELFAICEFFHSYPEKLSYNEIKDLCVNDEKREAFNDALENTDNEDQQLILCEQHENQWFNNLPELLDNLRDRAQDSFPEIEESLCEYDCKIVCVGCDKRFHEIKNEAGLSHDEELPESVCTNSGDNFCHIDCLRDSR